MKKILILSIILLLTYSIQAESLFSLNASQNANQGKSFSAHIEASDPKTLAS